MIASTLEKIANGSPIDDDTTYVAITEGAQRLLELHELLKLCLPHVQAAAQSEHTLSSLGPRHELPIDKLVTQIRAALK